MLQRSVDPVNRGDFFMFRNFFLINGMHRVEVSIAISFPWEIRRAGAAAHRGLSGTTIRAAGCTIAVATPDDEPALRELLNANPLDGWVRLSLAPGPGRVREQLRPRARARLHPRPGRTQRQARGPVRTRRRRRVRLERGCEGCRTSARFACSRRSGIASRSCAAGSPPCVPCRRILHDIESRVDGDHLRQHGGPTAVVRRHSRPSAVRAGRRPADVRHRHASWRCRARSWSRRRPDDLPGIAALLQAAYRRPRVRARLAHGGPAAARRQRDAAGEHLSGLRDGGVLRAASPCGIRAR